MTKNDIIIEKANIHDVDELKSLIQECFKKHQDIIDDYNPYYISKERIIFNINYSYGSFLKMVYDNKIIGGMFYYYIDEDIENIHIDQIFISHEYQHMGLGKMLFNYLFDTNPHTKSYHLDYVKRDEDVAEFYQSLGFMIESVEIDENNHEFVSALKQL